MNRVWLSGKEIASFEEDESTINFVEHLLLNETDDHFDADDTCSFELKGQGIIDVDANDLDKNGKLNIF